jgi:hypothetical protein
VDSLIEAVGPLRRLGHPHQCFGLAGFDGALEEAIGLIDAASRPQQISSRQQGATVAPARRPAA